jgi:predicted DCC family thiol-disulfide oxidoreductase YuxK
MNPEPKSTSGPIVLFDGVCAFCNRSVQTIIRLDKHARIRFAPLQGEFAAELLSRHPELRGIDSLLVVETTPDGNERISLRSTAPLRIAANMGGIWNFALLAYIVPRPVRDFCYDLFARYRYRLFGKYDSCMIPTPEQRARFLELG